MDDFDVDMFVLRQCLGTQYEKDKWFSLFNSFLERYEMDGSVMDRLDVLEIIYTEELPLLFKKWEEREEQLVNQGVQLMVKIAEFENKENMNG